MASSRSNSDGAFSGLTHPLVLLSMAAVTFLITMAVMSWNEGYFDDWLRPDGTEFDGADKSWMVGRPNGKHHYKRDVKANEHAANPEFEAPALAPDGTAQKRKFKHFAEERADR
jgi:hypothetical protein